MEIKHPWQMTVKEFAEQALRDYGLDVRELLKANIMFIKSEGKLFVLPKFDSNEVLEPAILRELCRFFDLPPLDFHLDPEADD
jgi:hypothetical protein